MSQSKIISTENAPKAVGPYSQAHWAKDMLFLSGQLGLYPSTGKLVGDDVAAQAEQAMKNLGAVLAEAGLGWGDVVKATIFLTDMNDFAAVNTVYGAAFEGVEELPARACIQVAALPVGGRVEVEAVAVKSA